MKNESFPKNNDPTETSLDSCLGQPCFQLGADGYIGKCSKFGCQIHVDLAKRECLCRLAGPETENNQTAKSASEQFFAGFIIRGTDEEIKQVKQYILTQTAATLILQKKDKAYLTVTKATE